MVEEYTDALRLLPNPRLSDCCMALADLALKSELPAMVGLRDDLAVIPPQVGSRETDELAFERRGGSYGRA